MIKRWVSLACLCLVLLGVPVTMGARADPGSLVPPSPTFKANGSPQYPYPVTVSKGTCTAWSIVQSNGMGDTLCAQALPTQQVGMYISLSYMGELETVCLVSIDARKQIAQVQ
jgi:hypothetical protein